jgi:hypothetical protein
MIDDLIKETLKRISKLEVSIYNTIIKMFIDSFEIDDSKITLTTKNIKIVESISSLNFEKKIKKIVKYAMNGINTIFSETVDDFDFDPRAIEISKEVKKKINNHAATALNQVTDLQIAYADIKKTSIGLLSKYEGISLKELRETLENKIVNKGLVKRYWSRWTYDIYNQYQRAGSNNIRKELGLTNAIYEGGLIEDSRPFCKERNGKVFTEQEIESWVDLDFKGKQEVGYNPIYDCGGYNCRHRLRWVTDETAKRFKKQENN